MKRSLLILSLLPTACSLLLPTQPSPVELGIQPWMRDYWHQAQNELSQMQVPPPGDPFGVRIEGFRFVAHPGPFTCGPVSGTAGCFYPNSRQIHYNANAPRVILHEAKHAILWALRDPRWGCVEHQGEECPGTG